MPCKISTHTSRVGCDAIALFNAVDASFLLTHPVWDVTHIEEKIQLDVLISTHTSRVGCDVGCCYGARFWIKFLLTHPVWDVTKNWRLAVPQADKFLLTHPVWDVTNNAGINLYFFKISTHTSRVGCDASSDAVETS